MINLKDQFNYAIANNLNMFVEKVYQTVDNGQPYKETMATQLICDRLRRAEIGEYQNLLINVPPRSLKSTIISIAFTAWLLGKKPNSRILFISYSEELAKEFSTSSRKVMESTWYQAAFPKTRLNPNKKTETKFETTQNGYRYAISLQGAVTGRGGEWIIIDDPQKPDDVLSDVKRNRTNKIFDNTIMSRLNNKCNDKIIVVGQRLHVDDFYSHVQKFGTWDNLVIPAIAQKDEKFELLSGKIIERKKGEVINPSIEPLEKLEQLESAMGEYNFAAQYLQNPIPAEGNIIKAKFFKYFTTFPFGQSVTYQSWDLASTDNPTSDYSVCITAQVFGDLVYITDIFREKLTFTKLLDKIQEKYHAHRAKHLLIESAVIGNSIIDALRARGIHSVPYQPKNSKVVRANAQTLTIEAGKVFLLSGTPWIENFIKEVELFPVGKHDDQVDALTQLLEVVGKRQTWLFDTRAANKYAEERAAEQYYQQTYNNENNWWKGMF